MVNTYIVIFLTLGSSICGNHIGEFDYLEDAPRDDTKQFRHDEYSKRSARKPFCVFSQEAKDSKFMAFLSEVSFSQIFALRRNQKILHVAIATVSHKLSSNMKYTHQFLLKSPNWENSELKS